MKTSDYIRKNALIYERYKDNFDELGIDEIETFRAQIERAYKLIPHGDINVNRVTGQPYVNVLELTNDVKYNRCLQISEDNNNSRLLPGDLNLRFRAVHDYIHYLIQAPFTAEGEIAVYNLQKKLHSEGISQKILFSEVVLQACYVEYFGRFAPVQKVVLYNGKI